MKHELLVKYRKYNIPGVCAATKKVQAKFSNQKFTEAREIFDKTTGELTTVDTKTYDDGCAVILEC